ncbi:MAG: phenol degradation protein meta [Desulfuromonas sp.]|nr:MAG: phenol degradation protein meta [Desulfuromonas sp.]
MKMLRNLLVCSVSLAIIFSASNVFAFLQPNVNLGFTSFLDGGPPAGPGHYISEYLQFYTADKLVDGPPGEVDATILMNQYIYQSDQVILGSAKWGLNVMLPIVSLDENSPALTDNGSGLGDLLVGPYLQWDPIMGEKGPLMLNRVEFQMIFPTGDYEKTKSLNQGSNHFSFNPYWAATVFLGPKATVSWRLHYLWNDENDDFMGSAKLEPGQAIHANFAMAYELMPKQLRLGLNGYFFEQISDTKVNGVDVGDDEKVFAIGPGLVYHFSQDSHLFLNAYFESSVEDRPEGDRYNLRFVHHF